MSESDIAYLQRRERQHRDRAEICPDPAARKLHVRFADSYAERIRDLGTAPVLA